MTSSASTCAVQWRPRRPKFAAHLHRHNLASAGRRPRDWFRLHGSLQSGTWLRPRFRSPGRTYLRGPPRDLLHDAAQAGVDVTAGLPIFLAAGRQRARSIGQRRGRECRGGGGAHDHQLLDFRSPHLAQGVRQVLSSVRAMRRAARRVSSTGLGCGRLRSSLGSTFDTYALRHPVCVRIVAHLGFPRA